MKKLVLSLTSLVLLFFGFSLSILTAVPASANAQTGTGSWINHSRISGLHVPTGQGNYSSGTYSFLDSNDDPGDPSQAVGFKYYIQGFAANCGGQSPNNDYITVANNGTSGTLHYFTPVAASSQCASGDTVPFQIDPGSLTLQGIYFNFQSPSVITTSNGLRVFDYSSTTKSYIENDSYTSADTCKNYITIPSNAYNSAGNLAQDPVYLSFTFQTDLAGNAGDGSSLPPSIGSMEAHGPYTGGNTNANPCLFTSPQPIGVTSISNGPSKNTPPQDQGPGTTGADAPNAACSANSSAFAWAICPLVNLIQGTTQTLYNNIIQPLLQVTPLSQDQNLKAVWTAFLAVADIFFVVGFIALIFGTALSLNIDAYTIKKALPRLVVAAVLIQFSYFICSFVVDLGNIFGEGILSLIFQTIHNVALQNATVQGAQAGQIGAAVGGTTLLIAGGITAGALAGPALLVLLAGFLVSIVVFLLTLVIRQLIIYALVIIAPIAIAASILPNTERLFKMWWQNFLKVILMYPLIALLIGASYVMESAVTGKNTSDLEQFVAILAPTIAFFLMPATFKMAGSAMSLTGASMRNLGRRGSKAARTRTQNALDNSAVMKNRRAKNEKAWQEKAETGKGFTRAIAQRRLGLGWVATPGAKKAITGMRLDRENKDEATTKREMRDFDFGKLQAVLAAGIGKGVAGIPGMVATEQSKRVAIDRLAQARRTEMLEQSRAEMSKPSMGEAALFDSALAQSSALSAIIDKAPHLAMPADKAYTNMTSEKVSKLDATGAKGLVQHLETQQTILGSHAAGSPEHDGARKEIDTLVGALSGMSIGQKASTDVNVGRVIFEAVNGPTATLRDATLVGAVNGSPAGPGVIDPATGRIL